MNSFDIYQSAIGDRERGFFHHAFFIEDAGGVARAEIKNFLKEIFQIEHAGNPDFHEYVLDRLYLADADIIKSEESKRTFIPGAKKIFCVSFDSVTQEAGNAFLKVLEEPSEDSVFFFFAPSKEALLPTLRSRFSFVSNKQKTSEEVDVFCERFLKSSKKERLEQLAETIKNKDKAFALQFLNGLEVLLREKIDLKTAEKKDVRALEEIIRVRGYLRDTSSSAKLLLEHIALTVPQF